MKYRLFLIIATFAVLGSTITSCSMDDVLRVAPNDGDLKTPISFDVNIGTLPDPDVTTRGYTANTNGSTYTFNAGDVVAIAVKGKSGSSRSTSEVKKLYTVAAGSGTKTLSYSTDDGTTRTFEFDWLSTHEVVDARAWSWGNGSTPTTDPVNAPFEIETNQNTGATANTKELLYSPSPSAGYGYSTSAIQITLYHQLARIIVNVSSTLGGSVTGVQIGHTDYKVPLKGTFAYSSGNYGTWTPTTTASEMGVITAKEETAGSVYSAVVFPSTYAANNKFIVITTSGGTYYYAIPIGGITLEPGKQYTFSINNQNQIDFNVTVSAWDGGGAEPAATNLTFSN